MNWASFSELEPGLAALGEERFRRCGMLLLGTLRKNGWPRISPVEMLFFEGELYLGMMWQSRKALDLRRDSRCTLHNAVSNKDGTEGDFKVYGRAVEVLDLEQRRRYGEALFEETGIRIEEPEFHLFSIDIGSASFMEIKDDAMHHRVWNKPGEELEGRADRIAAP